MRSEIIGPAGTKTASGEIGGLSGSKTIWYAVKTAMCFNLGVYLTLSVASIDICSCVGSTYRALSMFTRIREEPSVAEFFVGVSQGELLGMYPGENHSTNGGYYVSGCLDDPFIYFLGSINLRAIHLWRRRTSVARHLIL